MVCAYTGGLKAVTCIFSPTCESASGVPGKRDAMSVTLAPSLIENFTPAGCANYPRNCG